MKKTGLLILLIPLLFTACKKHKNETSEPDYNIPVFCSWRVYNYSNSVQTMIRTDVLTGNMYGFRFKEDGGFIEHKNSHECDSHGTYIYKDYDGTWSRINQDHFLINVSSYMGELEYTMRIVSISADTLKYSIVD
jgi:hypothetical protein